MTDIEVLEGVLRTLGTVAVAGKENMSKMLGCINALSSVVEAVKQTGANESEVPENG